MNRFVDLDRVIGYRIVVDDGTEVINLHPADVQIMLDICGMRHCKACAAGGASCQLDPGHDGEHEMRFLGHSVRWGKP